MTFQAVRESPSCNDELTFDDVESAYQRISQYIHETPILTCSSINNIVNQNCSQMLNLYFKCENLQKTGSFKVI